MLASIIQIANVSVPVLKTLARVNGWDTKVIDENVDLVKTLIESIQQSGKYETLQDVLNDQVLMDELVKFISGPQEVSDDSINSLKLDVDSTVTCPKCGHITTFRILKHLNNDNTKGVENAN